jgi:flagellar biosynthetic protein FliP
MFYKLEKGHMVLWKSLCLIFCIGVLTIFCGCNVYATENTGNYDGLGLSQKSSNPSTVISQPGKSETADDLKELNVGNNLSVTYNDGNGNLSGSAKQ